MSSEAERLEQLWRGQFGDLYADRNAVIDARREAFWRQLLTAHPIASVLEVGCGQGANLRPIARVLPPAAVWGIDVNRLSVERARTNAPDTNVVHASARELPFRDGWFDLVFTVGVLIHQPDESLADVMREIVRCSRRFVLWAEYHADEPTEVPYRGQSGALIKRDFGRLYADLGAGLVVRDEGFLASDDGFDNATWQLLEKPR